MSISSYKLYIYTLVYIYTHQLHSSQKIFQLRERLIGKYGLSFVHFCSYQSFCQCNFCHFGKSVHCSHVNTLLSQRGPACIFIVCLETSCQYELWISGVARFLIGKEDAKSLVFFSILGRHLMLLYHYVSSINRL